MKGLSFHMIKIVSSFTILENLKVALDDKIQSSSLVFYRRNTPWSGARTQRKKNSLLYYTYFASEKCKMSLMYVVCSNKNGLKKIEFSQGSKVRWFRNWSRLKATDGYNIMLYCITQGNFSLSSSSSRPGCVPYLNY